MDHALGWPRARESIHPGRATDAVVRYLVTGGARPPRPLAWLVRFGEGRSHTIRFDGARRSRQRGGTVADVEVDTSPARWVRFLAADRDGRRRWFRESRAKGTPKRIEELLAAFGPGRGSTP